MLLEAGQQNQPANFRFAPRQLRQLMWSTLSHIVLPAGKDSPGCGTYHIKIRLVQFDGGVDVALVVAILVGTHVSLGLPILDWRL